MSRGSRSGGTSGSTARWRRPAFAVAILLGALLVAEAGVRAAGGRLFPEGRLPADVPAPSEPAMVDDPVTGWTPRVGRTEGFGIPGGTTVNALGMRGAEVAHPKPAGERRILVLGDSSVFGVLVADADTFPNRAERALRAIDPGIRVLDGGVPGWSSYQSRRALETRWAGVAPDLVVIASLWSDAMGAPEPDEVRFSPRAPALLEASRTFLFARAWVRHAKWGSDPETVRVDLGGRPPPDPSRPRPADLAPPPTSRVPLAVYGASLDALADTAAGLGASVAFLVLPCVRDPSGARIGDARDRYRSTMREVAARRGAPLADTPPAFVGGRSEALLFDDVHPTPAGHALVADTLVKALEPWARAGVSAR